MKLLLHHHHHLDPMDVDGEIRAAAAQARRVPTRDLTPRWPRPADWVARGPTSARAPA